MQKRMKIVMLMSDGGRGRIENLEEVEEVFVVDLVVSLLPYVSSQRCSTWKEHRLVG